LDSAAADGRIPTPPSDAASSPPGARAGERASSAGGGDDFAPLTGATPLEPRPLTAMQQLL